MISYQASGSLFCCFSFLEDPAKLSVGIRVWDETELYFVFMNAVYTLHWFVCLFILIFIFLSACARPGDNLGGTGGGQQEAPVSTAGLSVISRAHEHRVHQCPLCAE